LAKRIAQFAALFRQGRKVHRLCLLMPQQYLHRIGARITARPDNCHSQHINSFQPAKSFAFNVYLNHKDYNNSRRRIKRFITASGICRLIPSICRISIAFSLFPGYVFHKPLQTSF
jgi:hypothetical protein